MAIQTNVAQPKEFLQRENIRTMRKDLARLREADALRESEKIIKTKTPELKEGQGSILQKSPKEFVTTPKLTKENQPEAQKTIPPIIESQKPQTQFQNDLEKKSSEIAHHRTKKNNYDKSPVDEALHQKEKIEQGAVTKAREYANEEEKQKIFLLESQKKDLEKQMQAVGGEGDSTLVLEKNKILLEQKNWQEKLKALIEEEGKVEAEEKNIESQENQTNIPTERQNLEKKRWELESQRQKIEKKRWTIENELVKLESAIKDLDENYKIFNSTESKLKNKIAEINNSLREIYANISERETQRIKESSENQKSENARNLYANLEAKKKAETQNTMESPQIKEKEYLKEIPSAVKEKWAESTKVEEQQRRKFIEDVEKWASLHSNSSNQQ